MSVPPYSAIKPGTLVSIVLKQDQRTGRQVQGSVSQILTRGNHPRGVKVRLSDGRVGRVQQLAGQSTPTQPRTSFLPTKKVHNMADQNPWATEEDQRTGYPQNQQSQQQPYQLGGHQQGRYYGGQQSEEDSYRPPQGAPPHQQQSFGQQQQQSFGSGQQYYNQPSVNQQPDYNAWSDSTGNPPLPARHPARTAEVAPDQGVRRTGTDDVFAQQEDRGEQYEHMQAYEATAAQSEDDKNRAQLEKEFPDVDGSLIAALYSDTKDLSATREMLQELGRQ